VAAATVTTAAITGGIILIGMAIAIMAAGIGITAADTMEAVGAAAMRPLRRPKNPAVERPSVNPS
jgi:hypothetical protein